jgi:hypothetical protein
MKLLSPQLEGLFKEETTGFGIIEAGIFISIIDK